MLERVGSRHGPGGDIGDQFDVLAGGEAGNQIVELEDESDMFAAVQRQLALVGRGEVVVAILHRSR